MSESLDRRLGVVEYLQLRLHLLVCAWCARYLKQIKLIGCVLGQLPGNITEEPTASLSPAARQRIAKALDC